MRKIRWIILIAAAMLFLGAFSFAAAEEETGPDEWTVMIYFCGSDLESKYGYASENLNEIINVGFPFDISVFFEDLDIPGEAGMQRVEDVNILIETGGSRKWHAQSCNMNIDAKALQRWHYKYVLESAADFAEYHTFELMETLPLQSMADPETLADFIRWSAKTYPARKYALILWDHGDAAKGLLIDELFDNDELWLYELKQALAEGGVHLDTLIIDACQMANLETAWNVKDYADYMVASQEVVPGTGTAFGDWLQALVNHPSLGGRWLAKCICDMTGIKYANMEDEKSKSLMTWSVIDLKIIDPLITACGAYIRNMNNALRDGSPLMNELTELMTEEDLVSAEERRTMIDLGIVLFQEYASYHVDSEILDPIFEAFSDAVIYISRGQGRINARGLSFCFPARFSKEELDIYARNFPMPDWLAYLDAITPWTAPEEIYTQTERLPEVSGMETYQLNGKKVHTENGMPGISIVNPANVFYNLYWLDEKTGETLLLGQTPCEFDLQENDLQLFWAMDPMHWPTLEGTLCCIDLVERSGNELLYNIPIQINSETATLRCGRTISYKSDGTRTSRYEIYGLWEGYEENSRLLNRSVRPLAMVAGQRYYVLYPKDSAANDGQISYLRSEEKTMYRALKIEEEPLPAGTYYLEYQLSDLFMQVTKTDRIEIQWDGETMTFPNDASWTGSF